MKSLDPETFLNLMSRKTQHICLSIYYVTGTLSDTQDEHDEDR